MSGLIWGKLFDCRVFNAPNFEILNFEKLVSILVWARPCVCMCVSMSQKKKVSSGFEIS